MMIDNNQHKLIADSQPPLSFYKYRWVESSQELEIIWPLSPTSYTISISSWGTGIVLSSIENGIAITKPAFEPWHLPLWRDAQTPCLDLRQWVRKIPVDVFKAIQLFGKQALNVIELTSNHIAARELLISNTALFGTWYFFCRDNNFNVTQFLTGCQLKRVNILRVMKYEASNASVKILSKLHFTEFNWRTFTQLNNFFRKSVHKISLTALTQRPSVCLDHLNLIQDNPWFCATRLTTDALKAFSSNEFIATMLSDISNHGDKQAKQRAVECKTIQQFEKFYVSQFINHACPTNIPKKMFHASGELKVFPPPPFEGNDFIRPLSNYTDLWRTGRIMKNCVASLYADILSGSYYIYQANYSVQATIGIKIQQGVRPKIDKVLGYKNSEVTAEVEKNIESWFYTQAFN